ncbi:MAG: flagellar export chaperone FliS [Pseudomonadota bacterium]
MRATTSSNPTPAQQYRDINVRSDVEDASPHRLIQLLMARALTKIGFAKRDMERQHTSEKGRHIGDSIEIINGLQASLNHRSSATLTANLDGLYDYMIRRLLEANVQNNVEILDEVSALLQEIKEAWDAIASEHVSPSGS